MFLYASATGTKRNLAALKKYGWRILISRAGAWDTCGFPYALDNGAWADHVAMRPFDEPKFIQLLDRFGANADWVVTPDIVAGGRQSLVLSLAWLARCRAACPRVLIAAQDGMEPSTLAPMLNSKVGVFLGGSTEWKLAQMSKWGIFCAERDIYFHVGRVNTKRRIQHALDCGACSIDGTSATRYAVTTPLISAWAAGGTLLAPKKGMASNG